MVKKVKAKTEVDAGVETEKKISALERMTTVSFRTRQVQKKKAEKIFSEMGISTSAAINMFLAQVVRDKGMPFTPTTKRETTKESEEAAGYVELEELWEDL